MKKIVAALLTSILLICSMTTVLAAANTTPDETINAFVEAIARNDFDQAMALNVAESMAEAYNWQHMVGEVRAYLPMSLEMPAPSDYEAYQPINTAVAKGRFASSMYMFIASFFTEDGLNGTPFTDIGDEWLASYVKSVDPSQLASLHVVKLLDIPRHDEEALVEMFTRQAARLGGDEQVEKIAVYQLGDKYFLGSFQLIRYGDHWYIRALNSTFTGINLYGAVIPLPDMPLDELLVEIESSL